MYALRLVVIHQVAPRLGRINPTPSIQDNLCVAGVNIDYTWS